MITPSCRGCRRGSVPAAPQHQTRHKQTFMPTSCIRNRRARLARSRCFAASAGSNWLLSSDAGDRLESGLLSLLTRQGSATASPARNTVSTSRIARATCPRSAADPHVHLDARLRSSGLAPVPSAPRSPACERATLAACVLSAHRSRRLSSSDRDLLAAGAVARSGSSAPIAHPHVAQFPGAPIQRVGSSCGSGDA
jgi:hypothetical protein